MSSMSPSTTTSPGLAEAVLTEHGRVDVLVNNVGDYRPLVPFHRSTPHSWRRMYEHQPAARLRGHEGRSSRR